jgi:hypothetical protein
MPRRVPGEQPVLDNDYSKNLAKTDHISSKSDKFKSGKSKLFGQYQKMGLELLYTHSSAIIFSGRYNIGIVGRFVITLIKQESS